MIVFRLLVFIFFLLPSFSFGAVDVSDFSFIGKDISELEYKPLLKNISLNFKEVSSFDTYIEKLKLEEKEIQKDEYSSKEPGFMYSGKFGTELSSAFIGSKAFRNYFVKMYIREDYFAIVQSYPEYSKKLTGSDFEDECKFIYAVSSIKTASRDLGEDILNEIVLDNRTGFIDNISIDYLGGLYKDSSDIPKIKNFVDSGVMLTPSVLYNYLDYLNNNERYEEIIKLAGQYSDNVAKYPFLNDFMAIGYYYAGDYESFIKLAPELSSDVYPLLSDVYLRKGDFKNALEYALKIKNEMLKKYLVLKISLYEKKIDQFFEDINEMDESFLFSLFFDYIKVYFPDIDFKHLNKFNFNDPKRQDHKNFYAGLISLKLKNYQQSALFLEKIAFNEVMMQNALFYKGVAYSFFNIDLSELYLKRYILEDDNREKLNTARYLLAQIYVSKGNMDGALVVLDLCDLEICRELKGEIFFSKGEYDTSVKFLSKIHTDRSNYILGSIYYKLKIYDEALTFLKKIKNPDENSDFLKMLVYFKLNIDRGSAEILSRYDNNLKFVEQAVNYYFLRSKYKEALTLIDKNNLNSPYFLLLKAKSHFSIGEMQKAEAIFTKFINSDSYLFDSFFGIMNIKKAEGDSGYLKKFFELIKNKNFEKKDEMVFMIAKDSLQKGNLELSIEIINYYFDTLKVTPKTKEPYLLRSEIFKKIKKYQQCVDDTSYVLRKFGKDDDTMILMAECYEYLDKKKALEIYSKLGDKEGFSYFADKKIIEISEDPYVLRKIAYKFKENETDTFYSALLKAMSIVGDNETVTAFSEDIPYLIQSKTDSHVLAGLYYKSLELFYKNELKESVRFGMKAYYIDEHSDFSKLALMNVLRCYESLNDKSSAEKIKKILKGID